MNTALPVLKGDIIPVKKYSSNNRYPMDAVTRYGIDYRVQKIQDSKL